MVKSFIRLFLLWGVMLSLHAQSTASTIDELDKLDAERALISKQLEVAKLKGELNKAIKDGGVTSLTGAGEIGGAALNLIKISGLEVKPQATFLYSGYRIVASKGDMVIPNYQLTNVTQSYAILKDIRNGKENILWLSFEDASNNAQQNNNF